MRFALPRDAILTDQPRSPNPTPAHHILHSRQNRGVTRGGGEDSKKHYDSTAKAKQSGIHKEAKSID